jgi:hypothetical protein
MEPAPDEWVFERFDAAFAAAERLRLRKTSSALVKGPA